MVNEYLSAFLDGTNVMLLHRTPEEELRARRVPAEYVNYFRVNDLDPAMLRLLRNSSHVVSLRTEGDWLRVGWRNDQTRRDMLFDKRSPLVAAGVTSYEGDVDPVRRWCTDNGVKVARPKRVYLDIETDSRVSFANKEEMRVLAWAVVDENGKSQHGVLSEDTDAEEKILLDAMWMALRPYDQVVAWNGDGFDFPVIFARSERCGCTVNVNRWLWLDHMVLFKRLNMHSAESGDEKQSMALDNIAQAKLGEGKQVTPQFVIDRFGDKSLGALAWDLWEAGGEFRALLVKYNVRDTELLRRIEDKTGYIALFQTLCEVCHLFGSSDSLNPTRQMDGFMLRLGLERGYHFPTKRFRDEADNQFKGAFVMEPSVLDPAWRVAHKMSNGFLRNVHVADFASLYPSIILTWNMSPDTLVDAPVNGPIREGCCRAPSTGITFSLTQHGILTAALRELIRLRKVWNDKKAQFPPRTPEWYDADRRSTAYKVAANSFYGVVGSPFSRYFDKRIAESVTQSGVWLIQQTIEAADARGWDVVYADTDSLFVIGCSREEFTAFVKGCNEHLYPELLRKQGCTDNQIKLAYEKEFRHIIFSSAKRYAGRYEHYKGKSADQHSKPEVKGLEFNRGDAAKLARTLQGQVIRLLMEDVLDLERYHTVLSHVRTHVLEEALTLEEVKLSKALSKPLREYVPKEKLDGQPGALPPHVVVAKVLKERGAEVREGARVDYFVVDGAAQPMKVAPAEDYKGECDRFYVWEDLVFPPSLRLLASAFPEHDWETSWAKVRPRKIGRRVKVLEGQLPLPSTDHRVPVTNNFTPAPTLMMRRVRGDFEIDLTDEADLDAVAAVLARHPGPRRVVFRLHVEGQIAVLDLPHRVSGTPALLHELSGIRGVGHEKKK